MGNVLAGKFSGQQKQAFSLFSECSSELDAEFFGNFESEHTRRAYRADLMQFFDFVRRGWGPLTEPSELQSLHVVAFRNMLQAKTEDGGKSCSPKTVIRKLAAVTSYCSFLTEKGLLNSNPAAHVRRPLDEVMTETNDLSDEQVKHLFSAVDLQKRSGPLHLAVLAVLFSTGVRKSELINLRREDYREQQGVKIIQFRGKRGKVSRVPLHPFAVMHLEGYLRHMDEIGRRIDAEDFLFQSCAGLLDSRRSQKLQGTSVDYIIKKYAKAAGINENVSPHSARATLIGSLLESGCDLYRVSQLVNHSNVRTTQEYDKRKKRLVDSPVFKLKYF